MATYEITWGNPQTLIETLPTDPWDNPYLYRIEGERSFSIISKGADGQEGTDQDLTFEE